MRNHRCAIAKGLLAAFFVLCLGMLTSCQTTRYYERRKIADRCMKFDVDGRLVYIRNKIEAAREGGFGGFGSAAAGGCGCQ